MDVLATLNKTYHFITMRMVETGQAPHYTEIAKELSNRFLAVELIKMSDDWVLESSATRVRINMRKFPEIYHRCEVDNLELGFVHNHPANADFDFSSLDDINERNILHGLSGCNGFEGWRLACQDAPRR